MNGQRLYFPYCTIEYNSDLKRDVAVLFQTTQSISGDLLDDLYELEFSAADRKKLGRDGLSLYMDRLIERIKHDTLNDPRERLSDRITELWPACPFDEWLEDKIRYPWMTASYSIQDDWSSFTRRFDLNCKYHAVLPMPREQFEEEYGSVFIMTKMSL